MDDLVARLQQQADAAVESGTRWLTAADPAARASISEEQATALLGEWTRIGRAFTDTIRGAECLPAYALGMTSFRCRNWPPCSRSAGSVMVDMRRRGSSPPTDFLPVGARANCSARSRNAS